MIRKSSFSKPAVMRLSFERQLGVLRDLGAAHRSPRMFVQQAVKVADIVMAKRFGEKKKMMLLNAFKKFSPLFVPSNTRSALTQYAAELMTMEPERLKALGLQRIEIEKKALKVVKPVVLVYLDSNYFKICKTLGITEQKPFWV